jgi:hypothetical protein
MIRQRRRVASVLTTLVAVAGLTLTACGGNDESSSHAPSKTTTEKTPQEKKQEPQGKSERADLVNFQLDDRSQAGLTNIWVVWTIKNNSSQKSDYSWDWEAVDANGTRLTSGSQLETNVQPGQNAKGEYPTTL